MAAGAAGRPISTRVLCVCFVDWVQECCGFVGVAFLLPAHSMSSCCLLDLGGAELVSRVLCSLGGLLLVEDSLVDL